MTARQQKEIRCIGAYTVAAIAVALIAAWTLLPTEHRLLNNGLVVFAIFTALVGSSSFGTEISLGTFCLTLTQPDSRDAIWRRKMAVLAIALATTAIAFSVAGVAVAFGFESGHTLKYLLFFSSPAICAFGIAPCLTLLMRDSLAATGATVLIEWAVFLVIRFTHPHIPDPAMPMRIYAEFIATFTILGAAGWFVGKSWFRTMEVAAGPTTRWNLFAFAMNRPSATQPRGGPFASLVRKELRLQRPALVVAAVVAFALLASFWHPTPRPGGLKQLLDFYFMVFPVLVGATTVASERQIGILDWHLAIPVSARTQWTVKICVAYTLTIGLGLVMPWALVSYRAVIALSAGNEWFSIGRYVPVAIYGTAMTILASAQTRGPLRAAVVGMTAVIVSILLRMYLQSKLLGVLAALHWKGTLQYSSWTPIFDGIALATLWLMLFAGAQSFRQSRLRSTWSTATCVATAAMGLLIFASAALSAARPLQTMNARAVLICPPKLAARAEAVRRPVMPFPTPGSIGDFGQSSQFPIPSPGEKPTFPMGSFHLLEFPWSLVLPYGRMELGASAPRGLRREPDRRGGSVGARTGAQRDNLDRFRGDAVGCFKPKPRE